MEESNSISELKPGKADAGRILRIVLRNLVPVIGFFFFDWSGWEAIIYYYAETLIIGVFHAVKLSISQTGVNQMEDGSRGPMTPLFATVLFVGNYGIFTAVQIFFIWEHVEFPSGEPLEVWSFWISIAGIAAWHGFFFLKDYVLNGMYKSTPVHVIFIEPYGRIFLQQLFAIIGSLALSLSGSNEAVGMIIFVLLKTAGEIFLSMWWEKMLAHNRRHKGSQSDIGK